LLRPAVLIKVWRL